MQGLDGFACAAVAALTGGLVVAAGADGVACPPPGEGTSWVWSTADALLPNFDCRGDDAAEAAWDLVEAFVGSLACRYREGTVKATGWQGEEAELEAWRMYVKALFSIDDGMRENCPFGFAAVEAARWGACAFARNDPESDQYCLSLRVTFGWWFGTGVYGLSPPEVLPVFLNTRWMASLCQMSHLLRALTPNFQATLDPGDGFRGYFDCEYHGEVRPSGVNWPDYLERITSRTSRVDGDKSTVRYSFGRQALSDVGTKATECLLGFMSMTAERLIVFQQLLSEQMVLVGTAFASSFGILAQAVNSLGAPGADSFGALIFSRWPVLPLICELALAAQARQSWNAGAKLGYQHKPYELDFYPQEILRPAGERASLGNLRSLPPAEHLVALRKGHWGRPSSQFRAVLRALEEVLLLAQEEEEEHSGKNTSKEAATGQIMAPAGKLAFVSMIWGSRLAGYLGQAIRRAAALGHGRRFLVFCLDEPAHEACVRSHSHPALCIRGRLKTIFNKFTILASLVQSGVDALYLDFDTVLFKDPVPFLQEASVNAEVLVSRDFGSECLNTGVIYLKAHPGTADFLNALIPWLWRNPYEFSQKAFSGFLGHENISHPRVSPCFNPPVPRWGVLDPINAFVTNTVYNEKVEGWTGTFEGIVIYHFLDGTGGVDGRAVAGQYVNLYDLFYANPVLNLSDLEVPLWEQDPTIAGQLRFSRQASVPSVLHPCSLLLPDGFSLGDEGIK